MPVMQGAAYPVVPPTGTDPNAGMPQSTAR
jgi:hypothetical protein